MRTELAELPTWAFGHKL